MSAYCETCGVSVTLREPGVLAIYNCPDGAARKAWCPRHAKTRPATVRSRASRGWAFIHALDRRFANARTQQSSGTFLQHERQAVRAGDHSPLHRELEPEMEPGKVIVLSWERSKPVVADRETGETIRTPARPVLWVTITNKVRKAKGGWAIRFDVDDHRDRDQYMRRVPPAQGADDATEDEARRASSYTTDARSAIERVATVPEGDQDRFAAEARVANALRDSDSVKARLERIGQMPARERMDALHRLASERGVDVRDDVKAFERRVLRRLGKVA